jgi:hypothetical protein
MTISKRSLPAQPLVRRDPKYRRDDSSRGVVEAAFVMKRGIICPA